MLLDQSTVMKQAGKKKHWGIGSYFRSSDWNKSVQSILYILFVFFTKLIECFTTLIPFTDFFGFEYFRPISWAVWISLTNYQITFWEVGVQYCVFLTSNKTYTYIFSSVTVLPWMMQCNKNVKMIATEPAASKESALCCPTTSN